MSAHKLSLGSILTTASGTTRLCAEPAEGIAGNAVVGVGVIASRVLAELPATHRFVRGALAQAIAGQNREGVLQTVWLAALLLRLYATSALLVSVGATRRRDVA